MLYISIIYHIIYQYSVDKTVNCFVPTPFLGEDMYTQMFFFVQTTLVDRYIHRREMRNVSGIIKILIEN